jgi:hypothetical protein
MLTVLDLCGGSGAWSQPYVDAGYDVLRIDIKSGHDVRRFPALPHPVRGVLAAPPCTEFASSGARWWDGKGEQALTDALAVVDACMRVILVHNPLWWAIENPVGRLRNWLGEPRMSFDPADYGDPYTKKTLLWGRFERPAKRPVPAFQGSMMHRLPPGPDRAALRSVTPAGFARAFFEANP